MSTPELTATFTAYFNALRQPSVDMVCAGGRQYRIVARAYAKKKGYTFGSTESLQAFQFEEALITKGLPSVTAPALEASATAAGVHVVFHVSPTTLSGDNLVRHSIIYRPGPDGWIDDLYESIAEGKVIAAAPTGLEHGSYCTTTITYPGIYAKEVALLLTQCENYPNDYATGRRYCADRLWWLAAANFNSQWLLDYRGRFKSDQEFSFSYDNFETGQMECEECTAILHEDVITYQCHCPAVTLADIDTEVAALKARWSIV